MNIEVMQVERDKWVALCSDSDPEFPTNRWSRERRRKNAYKTLASG